jgi:Pre-toxin TG
VSDRAARINRKWEELAAKPDDQDPKRYLEKRNERERLNGLRLYAQDHEPAHLRNWITTDPNFQRIAANALYDLRSSQPTDEGGRSLKTIGEAAVAGADSSFASGRTEEASYYYSVARAAADLLIGIDPVTGTLRAAYEALTGINLITGEPLSDLEQGIPVFTVATLGFGAEVEHGIEIAGKLLTFVKNSDAVGKIVSSAKFVFKQFTTFVGSAKSEQATGRFIEMLVTAGSGPWQRAKTLGAEYSKINMLTHGFHPELYQLENKFVQNVSLGEASRAEAEAIGLAFVGEDATRTAYRQDPSVAIYRSADGRRVYRQPIFKEGVEKYQANLEVFAPNGSGRTAPLSDAHIDIR